MQPGFSNEELNSFALDTISDATVNSLAYFLRQISEHNHGYEQLFGNTSNDMAADIPIKFTVVGGDNAYGTELHIHDGTTIESGSSTKYFDFDTLYIVSASAANKISVVQFLYSDINTAVACTFDDAGHADGDDVVISSAHGLSNGDKVVLKAGGGALPSGVNDYTTYYVVDSKTDTFNVSLTSGGAVVDLVDDGGACFWYPINSSVQSATQSNLTKKFISMAAVNADALPVTLKSPRILCNKRLFVRALSETGQTVSIGFLIGLHTYDS
jgi:hypothetical protein